MRHAASDIAELDLASLKGWSVRPGRSWWPREVDDFAPWVADNLDLLGEKLGLRLELVGREVRFGAFRADVVARDEAGRSVIIELQFGPSDHRHLGQIVGYASQARAGAVVWLVTDEFGFRVAGGIRPEHRDVLTWLNEVSPGQVEFFGAEVEVSSEPRLIHEPETPATPRISVVVRP